VTATKPALRVHIVVTHLLGRGHLARMRQVARALSAAGHEVALISGGAPDAAGHGDAGYRLVQLPALKVAPGNFRELLGADGRPVGDEFKTRRAEQLRRTVTADAPQVLLIESFPFGRRALRFELRPLLESVAAMQPRPLVLSSVRDILQPRPADRERHTAALLDAFFDAVLVHADPAVVKLEETYSLAHELRGKIFYTGYVHESVASPPLTPPSGGDAPPSGGGWGGAVVVSTGGGAVGFALLQTAIDARPLTRFKHRDWRLLVGRGASAAEFEALTARAGDGANGIKVEWARADFAALLAACAVSVSQAGYNTALDTVAARCRAVFVPYSRHGEAEQTLRAEKFAARGRAVVVAEDDLTAARLAAAIDRAARLDPATVAPLRLDGAAATVAFIERRAGGIAA